MDAFGLFSYAIILGGMLLYQLVRQSYRYDWWIAVIIVFSAGFTHAGMYPAIFARGHGYLTPNRVVGFLLYLLIYGMLVAIGAYRNEAETGTRYYKEWIEMKRRHEWGDKP